jgi:murein DD-endopeptidase MepM/ murein hydrolase activator NlpD
VLCQTRRTGRVVSTMNTPAKLHLASLAILVVLLLSCAPTDDNPVATELALMPPECGQGYRYPTTFADFQRKYAGRGFGAAGNHLGYDILYSEGTAVRPIACGKIVYYGPANAYGTLVVAIEHRFASPVSLEGIGKPPVQAFLTIYGHLRPTSGFGGAGTKTNLHVGNIVSPDTVIGYVEKGSANGDGAEHLHLGIRLQSAQEAQSADASKWLRGYDAAPSRASSFADPESFLPWARLASGDARWKSSPPDPALDEPRLLSPRALVGLFASGWRDETSRFLQGYDAFYGKLGYARDNGGGPFVHEVRGYLVQDFLNADGTGFGTDGQTALVHHVTSNSTHLLRGGFWGAIKCIPSSDGGPLGGLDLLGAPTEHEHAADGVDDRCGTGQILGGHVEAFQRFERGCMWWRGQGDAIHVHRVTGPLSASQLAAVRQACPGLEVVNNPPGPSTPAPPPSPTTPSACQATCTPGQHACRGSAPSVCSTDVYGCPYWSTGECIPGFACEPVSGQCQRVSQPEPIPVPSDPVVPVQSITCSETDRGLAVTVRGPVLAASLTTAGTSWSYLGYGSATDGWITYAATEDKPRATWTRDDATYTLLITNPAVRIFSLFVVTSGGEQAWLDLFDTDHDGDRFAVFGDCHLEPEREIWALVRGSSPALPAVSLREDAQQVCIRVDPSRLRWGTVSEPSDLCLAGNLPGIDWRGVPFDRADSRLEHCVARTQLVPGMPYEGCASDHDLPYRFAIRGCGDGPWAQLDAQSAGELWWSGVDDRCTCSSGLALALATSGVVLRGTELTNECL